MEITENKELKNVLKENKKLKDEIKVLNIKLERYRDLINNIKLVCIKN